MSEDRRRRPRGLAAAAVLIAASTLVGCSGSDTSAARTVTNVAYGADSPKQELDLYLPERKGGGSTPLVIYIHGGGWSMGDKSQIDDTATSDIKSFKEQLLSDGYAVASINYRLTDEAIWPAQIFDVKAAVRYLSAHADQYHLNADRFAAFGDSAGGHLVALLTTTNGDPVMEGTVGGTDGSSQVDVGVSFFGAYDLPLMQYQAAVKCGPAFGEVGQSKLIGGPVTVEPHLSMASYASPVNHVDSSDAPLLLLHGTKDCVVAKDQADEMLVKLQQAGVPTELISLDADHSAKVFFTDKDVVVQILAFIGDHV